MAPRQLITTAREQHVRNLFEDAAEALERALRRDVWFGDREPGPPTSLGPALMAQRLAGVLEIPRDQVTVHHDPTRAGLGPLAVVFEVLVEVRCAPVDQTVPPLRFAPIPGRETEAFFLRGHCLDCEAPDAAVAIITSLADLGYYLHLGRGPRTVFWELITNDTGHTGLCVWRHPTTRALAELGRGITDPPTHPHDPADPVPAPDARGESGHSRGPLDTGGAQR
jgi:hypothetical protein